MNKFGFLCLMACQIVLLGFKAGSVPPSLDVEDLKQITEPNKLYPCRSLNSYLMIKEPEYVKAIEAWQVGEVKKIPFQIPADEGEAQARSSLPVVSIHIGNTSIETSIIQTSIEICVFSKSAVYVLWDAVKDLSPNDREYVNVQRFEIQLHPGFWGAFWHWMWRSSGPSVNVYDRGEGYTITITNNSSHKKSSNRVTLQLRNVHDYIQSKNGRHYVQPIEMTFEQQVAKTQKCAPQTLEEVVSLK